MSLKKVGNNLDKMLAQVKALATAHVEVGHFAIQGEHYSGYTYAELMKFHHYGSDPENYREIPPRPLLDYVWAANLKLSDPIFKLAWEAWKKRAPSRESNAKLLDDLGAILAKKEKEMFGQSPPLSPNSGYKGRNTPLVDTGALKEKVGHRDTINKSIREV